MFELDLVSSPLAQNVDEVYSSDAHEPLLNMSSQIKSRQVVIEKMRREVSAT